MRADNLRLKRDDLDLSEAAGGRGGAGCRCGAGGWCLSRGSEVGRGRDPAARAGRPGGLTGRPARNSPVGRRFSPARPGQARPGQAVRAVAARARAVGSEIGDAVRYSRTARPLTCGGEFREAKLNRPSRTELTGSVRPAGVGGRRHRWAPSFCRGRAAAPLPCRGHRSTRAPRRGYVTGWRSIPHRWDQSVRYGSPNVVRGLVRAVPAGTGRVGRDRVGHVGGRRFRLICCQSWASGTAMSTTASSVVKSPRATAWPVRTSTR